MLFFAKKIEGQELVDTVDKYNSMSQREKDRAYINLYDTFKWMLVKTANEAISKLTAKNIFLNYEQRQQVRTMAESEFAYIIMDASKWLNKSDDKEEDRKTKLTPEKVVGYLSFNFKNRFHGRTIRQELGLTPLVGGMWNMEKIFTTGLSKFYKEYKRKPVIKIDELDDLEADSEARKDFEKLTEMMGVKKDRAIEIFQSIGPNKIKSLSQSVGGGEDGDENVTTLEGVLRSDDPSASEVYEDKELKKKVIKEAEEILTTEEMKIFHLMYHLDNPKADDLSIEDVAKKLEMPVRRVYYLNNKIKSELMNSPRIKALVKAHVDRFVKIANQNFEWIWEGNTASIKRTNCVESLIKEFLK